MSEDPIGFNGGDFNLYRYAKTKPLKYTDPTGLWTIGIGVGGSFGFFGGGGAADTQLVFDDEGNVGIANTICTGGVSEVAGASIGAILSGGNANTISDLNGVGVNVGISVNPVPGASVGGSVSYGTGTCGELTTTGSVTAGVGTGVSPVDLSGAVCKTVVIPLW